MPASPDISRRPTHAVHPGAGQESVWDYPRPPRLEPTARRIRVVLGGVTVADTGRALRVLETSHPPTYYIPPGDVHWEYLEAEPGIGSVCEWKGAAHYLTVTAGGRRADRAAWSYAAPTPAFYAFKGYAACYGGWVTSDLVGPFKGEPGSEGW